MVLVKESRTFLLYKHTKQSLIFLENTRYNGLMLETFHYSEGGGAF